MSKSILDRPGEADEASPQCILVAGATGGIGAAFSRQIAQNFPSTTVVRMARNPSALSALPNPTLDIALDITTERQIVAAVGQIPETLPIDWVFIATGWLHDADYRPEKTYKSLDEGHLLRAYRINAAGPALLVKHLIPRMNPDYACRIGVVSARVGSISHNRLGGWHAYRASKAALNMLIKNFAIELARNRSPHCIVGLQPGTTDTALSAPFQRSVPEGQLQTPAYTAAQLVHVMRRLRPADSGGLFDFLGLPFEP